MATFQIRVKDALGPRGYENSMRRSVQSVILYEAKRCIASRIPNLRPFQRKLALIDQAHALVDSLDCLLPQHKEEILWRTATSKEPLTPEIAWKREKLIEKEMVNLSRKIQPFWAPGRRSHADAVDMLVQHLYETLSGNKNQHPVHWEHAHNHVVFAYRLYYRGDQLDPTFPAPVPPKEIVVPAQKPKKNAQASHFLQMDNGNVARRMMPSGDAEQEPIVDVAALIGEGPSVVDERRKVLTEVREHLDLLKEFEGVISDEELAKRKRELFLALPSAPPSASKRSKV